jgi:hypothetical protein
MNTPATDELCLLFGSVAEAIVGNYSRFAGKAWSMLANSLMQ